jgi:hypothetical protein
LWKWLFGEKSHTKDDISWFTAEAKARGVTDDLLRLRASGRPFFALAHFPASLGWLRATLKSAGISHVPLADRLTADEARQLLGKTAAPAALTALAAAFRPDEQPPSVALEAERVELLVVERHFLRVWDERVLAFARSLGRPSRVSFHFSLDDPLLRSCTKGAAEMLTKAWELKETDGMVNNELLSRWASNVQESMALRVKKEILGDSAEDWLRNNGSP